MIDLFHRATVFASEIIGHHKAEDALRTLEQMLAELPPERRIRVIERYHEIINNPPEPSEALKEMVRKYGRFSR